MKVNSNFKRYAVLVSVVSIFAIADIIKPQSISVPATQTTALETASVENSENTLPDSAYPNGISPNKEKLPVLNNDGWEEYGNDDEIQLWRKQYKDSPVLGFRGRAVINANMYKVAQVLIDTSRKTEWVSDCMEASDVRSIGEQARVEYNKTHTPWPVKNRDFVFYARFIPEVATKTFYVILNSINDPSKSETNAVRGEIKEGFYIVKSIENGTKTELTVQIQADPKGAIPKWLANLTQKKWPTKTIKGIREQASKSTVTENAKVKAVFEKTLPGLKTPEESVATSK